MLAREGPKSVSADAANCGQADNPCADVLQGRRQPKIKIPRRMEPTDEEPGVLVKSRC